MAKIKIRENYCNEEEIAKMYFEFDNEIEKMYVELAKNNELGQVYLLIAKYIVKNYSRDANVIRKIILRHMTLGISLILECQYGKELYQYYKKLKFRTPKSLLSMEKENVNVADFDYINYLFFSKNDEEFFENIKMLKDEISDNKNSKNINVLLNYCKDYFYYNNYFRNDIDEYTRLDLIISHCLFDAKFSKPFEINFMEPEKATIDYAKGNKRKAKHGFKMLLLGLIINEIFESNNLDFNNEMKLKKAVYYNALLADKEASVTNYDFLECISSEKRLYKINKDKITSEFKFEYNHHIYIFTRNGIIPYMSK